MASQPRSKDYVVRLNRVDNERRLVGSSCKTHYSKQPMRVSKGVKQYLYDDMDYEFLDCSGNIAHVGHCHPHVIHCGQKQMTCLTTSQGFMTEVQSKYAKALLSTVSEGVFDTVFLVNSGTEAVDLAFRLAQNYTKRKDILCPQPSLFGHSSILASMHYKFLKNPEFSKLSWVHHIPVCNTYRGKYADSADPVTDAVAFLQQRIAELRRENKPIAGLLTETIHTSAGNLAPPPDYLARAVSAVKEAGGLVIIDEVLTGLGRFGTHWWSFQHFGVVPDIIVCGRSLGNGQPLAAVMTSQAIASSLMEYSNSHGGNPVSCAMGLAVIDVIRNEHLLASSASVGRDLMNGVTQLVKKHPNLGEVRGLGLCLTLDIVVDKESRKPAKELAEKISYRLRDHYRVIVPADGPDGNCLQINPPMCFSLENSRKLVESLDLAFTDIANGRIDSIKSLYELNEEFQIPNDVFGSSFKRGADNLHYDYSVNAKTTKYEDVD